METYIVVFALVATVVVALFLGSYVRSSMRMPETGWKVSLIVTVIGIASVILVTSWPPKQGIDLKGGIILIYEVDQELTRQNARRRQSDDDADDATGQGDLEASSVDMPALIQALSRRINPGGVQEIVVRRYGDDQVEIIIPDVTQAEAEHVKKLITTGGFLRFMIVANQRDHEHIWTLADDPRQTGQYEVRDEAGNVVGQWVKLSTDPNASEDGAPVYRVDPFNSKTRMVRDRKEVLMVVDPVFDLQGSHLASVRSGYKDINPCVFFDMTVTGSRLLGGLTTKYRPDESANHYSLLGIVMDGELISAPRINETITSSGIIEGSFTKEEVDLLVNVLRAGRLPAVLRPEPLSQNEISPLLGEDTIEQGKRAIVVSLIAVLVFMVVYYHFAGVVSCFALLLNLTLVLALMIFIGAAFSLPGMAGLVLTVGMSVDANVLIFERIREELRGGSALRMSIRNGFGRATRTIVDANVTTLITAVVLYVIGNEQLKAFAVTLICGILMCLFTSIFCARVVFDIAERRRWIKKLSMLQLFATPDWNLMSKRYLAAICSVIVILVGLAGVVARGPQIFDIDFLGGTSVQILLKESQPIAAVRGFADRLRDEGIVDNVSVTEVISEKHDPGSIYRIDTSLPAPPEGEESSKEPKTSAIEQVQLALIAQFRDADGQSLLQMHNFDFTPPVKPTAADQPPEVDTFGNPVEDSKASAEVDDTFDAGDFGTEEPSNDTSSPDNSNGDGASGEQASTEGESSDKPSASPDDDSTTVTVDNAEATTPPAQADTEPPAQADSDAVKGDASALRSQSDLTFDEKINAETIEGLIKDMAKELSLIEPGIVLSNQNWDGKSSLGFKTWRLQMSCDIEEADQILTALQQKLNATPVWLASNHIGSTVAGNKTRMAVAAVVASLLGIIGYIWIRFQRVVYGLAAVVALIHDVLITLGAIALSAWLTQVFGFLMLDEFKISLPVVAAFLTIIGYSLNDTIVVFDRIREVRGKSQHLTADMINLSINHTLSRTVLTSATTLIAVVILYVIGGQGIHAFAYALLVGVIVGTYSSIFVASPMLLWMSGADKPEKVAEKVAA